MVAVVTDGPAARSPRPHLGGHYYEASALGKQVSAGHESAYLPGCASAFGAGSVATTSNPRARYWATRLPARR